jgi:hypothetical protein
MGYKKKLYLFHPGKKPLKEIETYRTTKKMRIERCDPQSIEREVRGLLADKVSGNMVGIWLMVPEHLRIGTWDLLQSWTKKTGDQVDSRLAMQLINESSLCVRRIRQKQTLSQKGFELANGLPFVASDGAIHNLLDEHTVAESQQLQIALGKIRQTFGHFSGRLLAVDPHRIRTYSGRQMVRRKKDNDSKPAKMAQTFFCLDADTKQPVCFTTGTSSRTVTQATPELLKLTEEILNIRETKPLVLADNEHYSSELFDWVSTESRFEMLVPSKKKEVIEKAAETLPPGAFTRRWAGYATTKTTYHLKNSACGPYYLFIQRTGECEDEYSFDAFLCTDDRNEMEEMALNFPERWHIEEFFKNYQALGWNRAGTMNLNIQYGKMTMTLIAQAAIHMLRERIGNPIAEWDSEHLSDDFLKALEGDVRVKGDTIVVTYYNAPNCNLLRNHYESLPEKLQAEGINPAIPWLYDFKLDFRFK